LIAQSDAVVFVVSPEAVKSERCVWEVDRTIELSKRLLPVIFKPVPEHDIPEKLSRVQFVRFDSGPGLSELAAALRVDLHWIREYTRLGEMAARWDGRGRPESLLLRGDDLDAAKAWMAARKAEAPEITVAQRAFVKASEEAETTRLGKERAQLETIAAEQRARAQSQRRFACALLVLGVLVLGGLLAAMLQARETAHREAKVMTSVAQRAIQEGHHDRAMRIALQGLPPEGSLALVTSWSDGRAKLAGGALLSGPHVRLKGHEGSIVHAAFSPGGERVVTAANDGTARIWEVDTGREIAVLNHEGGRGRYIWRASFSPDGTRVLTATADDRTARVWDAATGKEIVALKGHEGTVWTAAFSPDGRRGAPSGVKAALWTGPRWPLSATTSSPVAVSQGRAIPSADAVTTRAPFGLKAALQIAYCWPLKMAISFPVEAFNTRAASPSRSVTTTRAPSELNAAYPTGTWTA